MEEINLWLDKEEHVKPEFIRKQMKELAYGDKDDLSVSRPKSRISWGIDVPQDSE